MAMTILYADDDKDDRDLLSEALEQIDPSISCITAHDGKEALSILQENRTLPDYIFLDVNMPVMDGKKCLTELKKNSKLKKYSRNHLFHNYQHRGDQRSLPVRRL
jgi:CheY-like chemotaxis protein